MRLPWGSCGAFVLIAAKNPCPWEYYGDPRRAFSYVAGAIVASRSGSQLGTKQVDPGNLPFWGIP
jgi:hypothetical protein